MLVTGKDGTKIAASGGPQTGSKTTKQNKTNKQTNNNKNTNKTTNLKLNEAQSARAESTHKGVN